MKLLKKISLVFLVVIICMFLSCTFADVGNFESYDSDWGGSDWGGSDWGGSDWGSDYSYGGYGGSGGSVGGGIFAIIFIIVIIVIAANSNSSNGNIQTSRPNPGNTNYNRDNYVRSQARSEAVANQVREKDTYFNDERFLAWAKNLFVKLQNAWMARDWETIRPLESEELFEQHSNQLKEYINRKQINKVERISVNFAELVSFSQDNEKDILVVALNSSMNDYIIDEVSGNVLKGSKDRRLTNTYKLIFTRKKGIVTEEGNEKLKTTNCPNCGAPTTITSSGKCEYCNAVITNSAHDWVLSDMERF